MHNLRRKQRAVEQCILLADPTEQESPGAAAEIALGALDMDHTPCKVHGQRSQYIVHVDHPHLEPRQVPVTVCIPDS